MMNKLLLTLSLLSAPTLAEEQAIYLGGWSHHLNGSAVFFTIRYEW